MRLAGQAADVPSGGSALDDRGYIMVVLLIAMAVTAIWMSAALPAWRQQAQRAREDDLVFRGEQYARAIVTYQKKNQGALPPNIDILVTQRYLRKKWKDPVTGKDFAPVGAGLDPSMQPGGTGPRGAQPPIMPGPTAPGGVPGGAPAGRGPGGAQQAAQGGNQPPGVSGVRSLSTATSIKIYNNQQQHNLWEFDARRFYAQMSYNPNPQRGGQPGQPGQGGPGRNPGQPGAPGTPVRQGPGSGPPGVGAPAGPGPPVAPPGPPRPPVGKGGG